MNKKLSALTLVTASALALGACSSGAASSPSATESTAAAGPQNITLWLAGGDTPDALRDYLKTTYKANNGGTLTIEEQAWPDLVTKLTTALPDANNTPDVVEVGNTQSPTFTNVGAFADISDMSIPRSAGSWPKAATRLCPSGRSQRRRVWRARLWCRDLARARGC